MYTKERGHSLIHSTAWWAESVRIRLQVSLTATGPAVAYRLLRHHEDAHDVVQETWLRYQRADLDEIANIEAWLTTVVTRLSLDCLRRRRPTLALDTDAVADARLSPHEEIELATDVEVALDVVLDELTPAQRITWILHDVFGISFADIAAMLQTSETAARRQASRARHRLRDARPGHSPVTGEKRKVVEAFLDAARQDNIHGLITVLHPDVVRTADPQALPAGVSLRIAGRDQVIEETRILRTNAHAAQIRDLGGDPILIVGDPTRLVLTFNITDGKIRSYDVIADPQQLRALVAS
ncbi:sigma-70 family RNA polymerase sigma factor [Brevibacterium sp. UMB10442]|uniref:sigma-70 family RNA polymerase sigma factor n=1 Tax=Brevibacterium sp. UMB1308A TaxID=3050608 RepID=UPI00254DB778|nr:sigma-70 family RNA polymerase sigma factor [Brevibacterium sp. UMB1308A]MDK7750800.1 sigma-70 family RNA polymerase sigma factor [Brevibacterium sp. UMB10442]MDK8713952.1 sigma-70 family RNA polymerase sigma factor [Brevibacterium sp. UMB1308A]